MRTDTRDSRLLLVSFILLFSLLGFLSAYILVGESSRSRILVEYEADRTASALAEALRVPGASIPAALDARVLGFGLYDREGRRVSGLGDAPEVLGRVERSSAFAYDAGKRRLELRRELGMGGMAASGPRPLRNGPFMRAMRQMMGAEGLSSGYLYLSLDVKDYFRRRGFLASAAVLVPAAVLALAAVFLRLISSNARLRKEAAERETLARLGESARTLVHEIRNPLGAIRIQTGILRQRLPDPAGAPELGAIDEEIDRLSELSRRVSDFLKNPRGEPRRVELDPFLAELARRSPCEPDYAAGEGAAGLAVLADPGLLRSAIDNLLRNAAESYEAPQGSTERSSVELRSVELRLEREGARAVVAVLDRGKGIPPEAADKIFDPFYTDKAQGSGIGLPLARRFVEAAGGELWLRPRKGGGTAARVSLPVLGEGP